MEERVWTDDGLAELTREFGDAYAGRTVPRHRRRRLHGLASDRGARPPRRRVVAFVRATSSGALNNIGHLRDRLTVSSPT